MSVPKIELAKFSNPKNFQPVKLGELILLGYEIPKDCRKLSERKIIYAETFWKIENTTTEDYQIEFVAIPERECIMPSFSQDISQGDDDSMWFTGNWAVGAVYKIVFALEMPPLEKIANADLNLEICVVNEDKICGVYRDDKKIEMHFSRKPYYNMKFPSSIYQNKPGQTWTAQQLADITGGKWITPPPENFFVRSIVRRKTELKDFTKPVLYVAAKYSDLDRHGVSYEKNDKKKYNSHSYLRGLQAGISAAIVSQPVKNLQKNFPQSKKFSAIIG